MKKHSAPLKLVTAHQAAIRYSVCPRTIRKWAEAGLIDHVRIGRRCVRYPIESLDLFIKSRTSAGDKLLKTVETTESASP